MFDEFLDKCKIWAGMKKKSSPAVSPTSSSEHNKKAAKKVSLKSEDNNNGTSNGLAAPSFSITAEDRSSSSSATTSSSSSSSFSGHMANPSMNSDPTQVYVLPSRSINDTRKYTIVLDLDETLIYGREGPMFARPGLSRFLEFLHGKVEVVVWTAGERDYAKRMIRMIDPNGVVEHCIYRHPKWFSGTSQWKDLQLCGRNMDNVLLVDNTPDCISTQATHSVLVSDFWGNVGVDQTLPAIRKLVKNLLASNQTVREFLPKCHLVIYKEVTSRCSGKNLHLFCLDVDKANETFCMQVAEDSDTENEAAIGSMESMQLSLDDDMSQIEMSLRCSFFSCPDVMDL